MRKSSRQLQKHTLNLYAGEFDRLRELFPDSDTSLVVRNIVHNFIERIEQGSQVPKITEDVK